jgi:hypothetical protein
MANLPLYMVDFACFNAPKELKVDFHEAHEAALKNWKVTDVEKTMGRPGSALPSMLKLTSSDSYKLVAVASAMCAYFPGAKQVAGTRPSASCCLCTESRRQADV